MAAIDRGVRHPFAPVLDGASRALVLGTFPSVQSRARAFYYGHPQNRFWPVLAALFDEAVPITAEEKRALLLCRRVALWDVLASCDIAGSADGSLRNPVPNDITALINGAPIQRIFCNGQAAFALYRRFVEPAAGLPAVRLPSTSPANARWTLEALVAAWRPLREAVAEERQK
jgi:double-stranded uracil-DNA glycosylase